MSRPAWFVFAALLVGGVVPAATAAELVCTTLYEDGTPQRVVQQANANDPFWGTSPQDFVPRPGSLRFFVADDGLGYPHIIRLSKGAAGAVTFTMDPAAPFELVRSSVPACPFDLTWCTTNWPQLANGQIRTYTTREAVGWCAWKRTFHAYVPTRVGAGPVPLVVVLHGGTGNGLDQLSQGWDEIADGRVLGWRPNIASCQYTYPGGYADPSTGAACTPPGAIARGTRPCVVVFPDGLEDEGAIIGAADAPRHWEDGRVPSPGQSGVAEVRDDVGFLDHVLAVMEQAGPGLVDPTQMYVSGESNGGMMAQRLACDAAEGTHVEIAKLAAIVAIISDLPAPLADGSDGRPLCPSAGTRALPFALMNGRGLDTPDCTSFPCASPVVDGDDRMPYGAPGGRYHVYSPELGLVLSGDDSFTRWVGYDASATGATSSSATSSVGFFTTHEVTTFGTSPARVERLVTDGGAHELASTRMDMLPWARAWEFLSGFQRLPDGTIATVPGNALAGTW